MLRIVRAFDPVGEVSLLYINTKKMLEGRTHHQCSSLDLHETREVLHLVGGGQLTTSGNAQGEEALIKDGLKVSTSSIDGGGVTCWA